MCTDLVRLVLCRRCSLQSYTRPHHHHHDADQVNRLPQAERNPGIIPFTRHPTTPTQRSIPTPTPPLPPSNPRKRHRAARSRNLASAHSRSTDPLLAQQLLAQLYLLLLLELPNLRQQGRPGKARLGKGDAGTYPCCERSIAPLERPTVDVSASQIGCELVRDNSWGGF